jgi:tRNA(fMet)-specific endonuclease VapC
VTIAALTAAELLVGVELADAERRNNREAFVEAVLKAVSIEHYDLAVARAHASLLAHTQRVGRPRGAHDLIIAATGRARERLVITTDFDGFADLPGVLVRSR